MAQRGGQRPARAPGGRGLGREGAGKNQPESLRDGGSPQQQNGAPAQQIEGGHGRDQLLAHLGHPADASHQHQARQQGGDQGDERAAEPKGGGDSGGNGGRLDQVSTDEGSRDAGQGKPPGQHRAAQSVPQIEHWSTL